MIKYFKYIFLAAIVMIAATGCQEDSEDAFSTKPAAPELLNNGKILMTENTMSEGISWAWSAARYMGDGVDYTLYAQYMEETPIQVGKTTKKLTVSMTKPEFHTLLGGIANIPENASYVINFYVVAQSGDVSVTSDKQAVTVYSYGNAVSAVVTPLIEGTLTLDVNNPNESIDILMWEPARFGYNETATYAVSVSYKGGKAVEIAKDITTNYCSITADVLNEALVEAGAPEVATSEIEFTVMAYSESIPDGIPSAPIKMNVTTYKATFPDFITLEGVGKKIPQSTTIKGTYDCFINFTKDAEFYFHNSLDNIDYGCEGASFAPDAEKGENNVLIATLLDNSKSLISVPAGLYRVCVNVKFKTLNVVEIKGMGIIGSGSSLGDWNADVKMSYDATSNKFSLVTEMKVGEFKVRANDSWVYAINKAGDFNNGGDNIVSDKAGEFNVVVDVNSHPYKVKILSTEVPTEEYIYIPGNHQGWSPATAPTLRTYNFDGVYTGISNLDGNFKFTKLPDWNVGEYNSTNFAEYQGQEGLAPAGDNDKNISMPTKGLYYLEADVMNEKLIVLPISSYGLIGSATIGGWDTETPMTFNEDNNTFSVTTTLVGGQQFKFRANNTWDEMYNGGADKKNLSLGGSIKDLTFGGENITVAENGTYEITLHVICNSDYKTMYCTMVKK